MYLAPGWAPVLFGPNTRRRHLTPRSFRRPTCCRQSCPESLSGWFAYIVMENQIGEEGERLNKHTTRLPRHKLKFGVAEILGAGVGGRVSHTSRSRSPQNPPTDSSTPETNIETGESETWCKTPLSSPSPPTQTPSSLPHPALLRLSLPRPAFSTSSPVFSPPLLFPYTSSPFLQPPPLAQASLPSSPLPFLQTQHMSTWYPSKCFYSFLQQKPGKFETEIVASDF